MAKKSNKDVLGGVSYSLDIIKKIQSGYKPSQADREEAFEKFQGMSSDNNSYFTPLIITKFMNDLVVRSGDYCCDLACGMGAMARPTMDMAKWDLFEFDSNTSIVGQACFEDVRSVNYKGSVDTLSEPIQENTYDCVLLNPPFCGSVIYPTEWSIDSKGKLKNKGKLEIVSAFIDKAYHVCKQNGYIAMVLPGGFLFKNTMELLRNWLGERCDLKLFMNLDSETFENSGIMGTSVGTVLVVLQKCKNINNKILFAELNKQDGLIEQLEGINNVFKQIQKEHYLDFGSSYLDKGVTGFVRGGKSPRVMESTYKQEIYEVCDFCNGNSEVIIKEVDGKKLCLTCDNDEYIYLKHIKKEPLSSKEKQVIRQLEREREIKASCDEMVNKEYNIYFLSNSNGSYDDYIIPANNEKFLETFGGKNSIKCRYNYIKDSNIIKSKVEKYDIEIEPLGYKIEWQKVRKPGEKDWRNSARKIHKWRVRFVDEDFYDTTCMIVTYDNETLKDKVNRDDNCCYTNYSFLCSMSAKLNSEFRKLIIDEVVK